MAAIVAVPPATIIVDPVSHILRSTPPPPRFPLSSPLSSHYILAVAVFGFAAAATVLCRCRLSPRPLSGVVIYSRPAPHHYPSLSRSRAEPSPPSALAGAFLSHHHRHHHEQRCRTGLLADLLPVVSCPPGHPPPLPSSLTAEPSPITASSTLLHFLATSHGCRQPVEEYMKAASGIPLQVPAAYPSPTLAESPLGQVIAMLTAGADVAADVRYTVLELNLFHVLIIIVVLVIE